MRQFTTLLDALPPNCAPSPAFTPDEHDAINRWSDTLWCRDALVEVYRGLYGVFEEILLVSFRSASEPSWLVHKTPDGAVAVRQWPGLAELVPTVGEALALIYNYPELPATA